ncbi:hypothetical protein ACJ77P_11665 [Syntrophus buswellii]|uniref:hypothetical protein n=1 Tax=Syntrophus buswellii TaxID=43774 RepID=UPI0038D50A1C
MEQYWSNFKDQFLAEHIENSRLEFGIKTGNALENDEESFENESQKDTLKHFRTKANTDFAKFVSKKLDEFIEECKSNGEIWQKDAYPYNRKWIVNDSKIKEIIKRYPKLLDIINFIDKEGKHDDSIKVENWSTFEAKTKNGVEIRKWSHVIVNKDFFRRAEEALGISQKTMQKYLQAFGDIGILDMVGQLQTHNRAMLYIDGYFRKVDTLGRWKKDRILNQKDHLQALRNFKY